MKKFIYKAALMLGVITGLTACNEKWEPGAEQSNDRGMLSTETISIDVTNAEHIITSRAQIDLSDYIVTVTDEAGAEVEKWRFADMPGLPMFTVGKYILKIESCIPERAAWSAPYFVGSKEFTIARNEVTEIGTVTCSLQNLKVTVNFADDLVKASAGDLNCQVRVNQEGVLNFTPAEKRSGYFEVIPGNTTMVATFTGTVNGYSEEIIRIYTDIVPGNHYIINFSIKGGDPTVPGESGQLDPTEGINVDFSVVSEDLNGNLTVGEDPITGDRPGHEEWPEDPINPDDPVTPTDDIFFSVPDGCNMKLDEPNDVADYPMGEDVPAIVDIKADEGIAKLEVTIDSESLDVEDVGLKKQFDLANPGDLEEALMGLGLIPADGVVAGKTQLQFNITTFIPLLGSFNGTHKFIIEVTDKGGHSKTLELVFITK